MTLTSPQRDWNPIIAFKFIKVWTDTLINQDNSHYFSGSLDEHWALQIRRGTLLSPKLIFFFQNNFGPEPLLCIHIQLFRARLLEKVHAIISKGIVGGF